MKIGVAYCRVSTNLEEQKLSIREQQAQWVEEFEKHNIQFAKCGCYCGKSTGYKARIQTNGLYVDEGLSGTSVENREAFNQMIADAKMGKFSDIFVEDVTRFSRSVADFAKYLNKLREYNVVIHFHKENTDTSDPKNDFALDIHATFAQNESNMKSERLKWSYGRLLENIQKNEDYCGWRGCAPYGYNLIKGQLYVNEEEAKLIQYIFDMYLNKHFGVGKITKVLADEGILSARGSNWSHTQIRNVLNNPIYCGRLVLNRTTTKDIIKRKKEDTNNIIEVFRPQLQIISDDIFDLTQALLQERKEQFTYNHSRQKNTYIFSGLMFCDYCKSVFRRKRRNTKEDKYVWVCGLHERYGHATKGSYRRCDEGAAYIQEEELLNCIKHEISLFKKIQFEEYPAHLQGYFNGKNRVEVLFNNYMQHRFKDIDITRLEKLDEEYNIIQQVRRDLQFSLAKGIMSREQYEEDVKYYEEQASNIRYAKRRIANMETDKRACELNFERYKEYMLSVDVDNLTNEILKNLFSKIYIRQKNIDGKKVIFLKFQYRFFDTTEDDIFINQLNDEGICDDLEIGNLWCRLDEYKNKE